MPSSDVRKMVIGFLVKHEGKYIVMQRPEEIEMMAVTYLADKHDVVPQQMYSILNMVVTRLKEQSAAAPAEKEKNAEANSSKK